jgi:antitoxin ParD1/3/4
VANFEKLSIASPPGMTFDASASEVVGDGPIERKLEHVAENELITELRRLWQEGLDSGSGEPLDMDEIRQAARAR